MTRGVAKAKVWNLDGGLERTIDVRHPISCVAALPDGRFLVGLSWGRSCGEVRLYHHRRDTFHPFKASHEPVDHKGLVVTRDGQHIISRALDKLVKVWSVASKSLVSTYTGHADSYVKAVAAMPDGQRILSTGGRRCPRVAASQRHPREHHWGLHAGSIAGRHLVALPDNQHALFAGRLARGSHPHLT